MATIELSEKQLQDLLQLVYLGEWMTQAYGNNENTSELEELEQKLYSVAFNEGFDEDVEFDKKLGGYVPTAEFEEDCDALIEKYDEQTFWEELIIRMANKELAENGGGDLPQKEFEKQQNELIKKYEKEFQQNGVENIVAFLRISIVEIDFYNYFLSGLVSRFNSIFCFIEKTKQRIPRFFLVFGVG